MPLLPPPPIKTFDRIRITDGLLINADRWKQAHDYHRQRQSVHYQSLNQPGIVCGLGVRLIPPPADIPAQYRDGRWLQIQPGIAIDVAGNPIVVPEPMDFRLVTQVATAPVTVYLVVSYVDPDKLRGQEHQEIQRETFRIDEKTHPPEPTEVELCRVQLEAGSMQLEIPADVFFPTANRLDLRYRVPARARTQAIARVAHLLPGTVTQPPMDTDLIDLLDAVEALYPALQGDPAVGQVSLRPVSDPMGSETLPATLDYDVLYVTGRQAIAFSEPEFLTLKHYLAMGGTLLVVAPADATGLINSVQDLAQQLGTALEPYEQLPQRHPLRTKPFRFGALPAPAGQPIQLHLGGGIVLVTGNLALGWSGADGHLSREHIRSAQEFGINLLHYAWSKHHLTGLMQSPGTPAAPEKPAKPKSVFDMLME